MAGVEAAAQAPRNYLIQGVSAAELTGSHPKALRPLFHYSNTVLYFITDYLVVG